MCCDVQEIGSPHDRTAGLPGRGPTDWEFYCLLVYFVFHLIVFVVISPIFRRSVATLFLFCFFLFFCFPFFSMLLFFFVFLVR